MSDSLFEGYERSFRQAIRRGNADQIGLLIEKAAMAAGSMRRVLSPGEFTALMRGTTMMNIENESDQSPLRWLERHSPETLRGLPSTLDVELRVVRRDEAVLRSLNQQLEQSCPRGPRVPERRPEDWLRDLCADSGGE